MIYDLMKYLIGHEIFTFHNQNNKSFFLDVAFITFRNVRTIWD